MGFGFFITKENFYDRTVELCARRSDDLTDTAQNILKRTKCNTMLLLRCSGSKFGYCKANKTRLFVENETRNTPMVPDLVKKVTAVKHPVLIPSGVL